MSLPDKDFFKIVTTLAPKAVTEKVKEFTHARGNWAKGKKIYLGKIGKDSFEITRRIERQNYKSGIPLVPMFVFMPKFLRGTIRDAADGSVINVTIEARKAISGVFIQALTLGLFPIVIAVAVIVILPIVFYLMGTPVDFGKLFANDGAAKMLPRLFGIVGGWLGVAIVILLFGLWDITRYKKNYAEIAAFEKQALATLLDGRIER